MMLNLECIRFLNKYTIYMTESNNIRKRKDLKMPNVIF